jgi:tRNA (guanine37-N1)-methyltransferase
MIRIDILTLFPKMFRGPFEESIVKRAQKKKLVQIAIHDLRKYALDRHKTVDDRPYGGGVGMVLMVKPVYRAIGELKKPQSKIILLTPQGKTFNQQKARKLAKAKHLILICGRYEGVDERIRKHLVDEEISIGDYVLTGGELPAMVVVDALTRLIPGVLEKPEATEAESFSKLKIAKLKIENCLEHPQYTRPADFRGWKVPGILLSGNHEEIAKWREKESLKRTATRRPDLLR